MNNFLSYCNEYPVSNSVIIMDNANIYCDLSTADVIRIRRYFIRYFSLHFPNYNPIELSFSILKSWIRRRFYEIWLFSRAYLEISLQNT